MHIKKVTILSLFIGIAIFVGTASATFRPLNILGLTPPYFSPDTILIAVGDSLIITNTDSIAPHTFTSDSPGLFNTGTLTFGSSTILTFSSSGNFPYHCSIHPMMVGLLQVTSTSGAFTLTPGIPISMHPGQTKTFSVTDGTPTYTWSLITTSSGLGSLNATVGTSVVYTAGTTINRPLRVAVTDSAGKVAWSDFITITPTSAPINTEPNDIIKARTEPVGTLTW